MNTRAGTIKHLAWLIGLSCMLGSTLLFAQMPTHIQKCKDQAGQWQYGSRVNAGCQSSISELNNNGIIINQSEPFKPASGLQVLALKQQQLLDQSLLRHYSSVKSIEQEKQRKVSELTNQQSINLEIIEKMGSEIHELKALSSLTAQSAFRERLTAINQYLNRHESLSKKLEKTTTEYNQLISDYLQALSRSRGKQSAGLNLH